MINGQQQARDRAARRSRFGRRLAVGVVAGLIVMVGVVLAALWANVLTAVIVTEQTSPPAVPTIAAPAAAMTRDATSPTPRTTQPLGASGQSSVSAARVLLAQLPVLPHRPFHPGYERGCSARQACSFGPAWTDDNAAHAAAGGRNGCDTRNDVLRRDLHQVRLRAGSRCVVVSGALNDPYTGTRISFLRGPGPNRSRRVQIDHVVPLALAWDLGAWRWPASKRVAFANDEALVLVAVSGAANEAKSDAGPAQWMPPNRADWCAYDAQFVTVLARYRLPITEADHHAVAAVLDRCAASRPETETTTPAPEASR